MVDIQAITSGQRPSARSFFELLGSLGPLRVISIAGPSVFEAICSVGHFGISDGHLHSMTETYHWHLGLSRFRHLRSHDALHERSGRRVLYFALAESADAAPFLFVYLHREREQEFDELRERLFLAAHRELAPGVEIEHEEGVS